MAAAAEPLISVKHVNHYFGDGELKKQVLFDISAEIVPGEIEYTVSKFIATSIAFEADGVSTPGQ